MQMTAQSILNRIIEKGGFIAGCARIYLNDEEKGHQFILECSEQCHTTIAREYWGENLIRDIKKYCESFNSII